MSRVRSVVVVMCSLVVMAALQIVLPVNQLWRTAADVLGSPVVGAEAVGVACGVAAWACLGWLCVAVAATMLGTLPGRLGALGRRISALSLPAMARPALAGVLGLALLQGGPAGAVTPGAVAPGSVAAEAVMTEAVTTEAVTLGAAAGAADRPNDPLTGVSLDWPTPAPTVPAPTVPPPTVPAPTPSPPTAPSPTAPPSTAPDMTAPARKGPTGTEPSAAEKGRSIVRVRPGDTLWDLAAARLGPRATKSRTASEWPRWWAANREVIGTNPDVVRPGQQLIVPSPRT